MSAGVHQRDDELAFELALLRRFTGSGNGVIGKALELLALVDNDGRGIGFLEQVLAEAGRQAGQLGIHRLQPGLVGIGELGTGTHEIGVVTLDQALRFRVEAERVACVVDRLDAGKQLAVEHGLVIVRGQLWRQLGLDLLHLVIGVGARLREKHARNAAQQLFAAFQGDDGVVETGRFGIVGDGLDFAATFGHALFEGRSIVLVADLVELRELIGQRTRRKERIDRLRLGGLDRLCLGGWIAIGGVQGCHGTKGNGQGGAQGQAKAHR